MGKCILGKEIYFDHIFLNGAEFLVSVSHLSDIWKTRETDLQKSRFIPINRITLVFRSYIGGNWYFGQIQVFTCPSCLILIE